MKKKNPPVTRIYRPTRNVTIAGMQKAPGHPCDAACKRANHKYIHEFKEPVEVLGLANGDVVLRSRKR